MTPADARLAAQLLAVDPRGLGGAVWSGPPGPAREAWVRLLRSAWPAPAPCLRLPIHVDDDRLFGGLDLGATLQAGRPVHQRGLLAQADGGLLLLPMAERLPPARAAALAAALDDRTACVAMVAFDEGQGGDAPLPVALTDRLAFCMGDTATTATTDDILPGSDEVAAARRRLADVHCDDEVLEALVTAADALGIVSLRASWQAVCAARAAAAWAGHAHVTAEDAALAARLVLAPRATRRPAGPEDPATEAPAEALGDAADAASPDTTPALPPPGPAPDAAADRDAATPSADPEPAVAADQVLQAALAALPADLLAQLAVSATRRRAGAGGRAGATQSAMRRGRPCGARRGDPRTGARLHLVATLRAAAPWQGLRAREAAVGPSAPPVRVRVRREDFHVIRHRQRRETTTVFVVDASGSAALHRLAEAKGAVELLLADCYVRRDRVALVAFRGTPGVPEAPGAELLLPPTRSLVRAKRCLAALPGGGGTPLAAGLDLARRVVDEELRRGATPVAVVLSDGRANLARDGTQGRAAAADDALRAARAWCDAGVSVLWLDTSPQPQAAAQAVARAMGARYLPLPHADARQVSAIVRAA
jgi:magnesium chelatase subunit D